MLPRYRQRQKIFLCFFCLIVLSLLGALAVSADVEVMDATIQRWDEAEADGSVVVLEDFSSRIPDGWMPATNVREIIHGFQDGIPSLYAELSHSGKENKHTVMRLYDSDTGENLLEYANLSFPLRIEGSAETYVVRLTLHSGVQTYQAEATVPGGEWVRFTADIDDWTLRTSVNLCEITVETEEGTVYGFWIGSLEGGGNANLGCAESYMTFGFQAEGGEAVYQDGLYSLHAGADGMMTLIADAARPEYSTFDGRVAIRIVLRNAREGGEVSLAVSAFPASDRDFVIASNCSLYYGENTYLLPFDHEIALRAYRLSFRGLHADEGESVELVSVSLETFPEITETENRLSGRMTQCEFSESMQTLSVSGTIPASVVAEHIGARIELYEIPVWESAETTLRTADPIASMKISTRYTFEVDLSGKTDRAAMSRYMVVIHTEEAPLPVTSARYPTYPSEKREKQGSVIGLYGAESADVFASNASSVLVDVYVDRLIGGKDGNVSGQLYIRDGDFFYFDYAYLKKLDADIAFYLSADVEVYLRFVCGEDLSEAGYTYPCDEADFYAFDVSNRAGANMLCAVAEFISERYPSVGGFVAGERLDAALYNGTDISDLHTYARNCANVMRLLYNSAVIYNPSICVVAPLGHHTQDARLMENRGEEAMMRCDPVLLAAYISWQLEQEGEIPWSILYISDHAGEALGHMKNILTQLKAIQCSTPQESMLLWLPTSSYNTDTLLEEYAVRCENAQDDGVRALFLSVTDQEASDALYSGLKTILNDENSGRRVDVHEAESIDTLSGYTGVYPMHDFSNAYSTLGWMAGSGCTRIGTQASGNGSGRSLHAVFSSPDGERFTAVQGNILCTQDQAVNLVYAPYIVYSLQVLTQLETTTEAELTFVFGSGDVRAEYSIVVETGKPVQIVCDLSEFSGTDMIRFSAIMVQCDSAVDVDIHSVSACSTEYSTESLKGLYAGRSSASAQTPTTQESLTPVQVVLLFASVCGGVVVLALLSRRKESNSGESGE